MTNFAERRTYVQYWFLKLGFSESKMLTEVGNKVVQHNFDVLNSKILVTNLEFVF